jgi:hypothetical protein
MLGRAAQGRRLGSPPGLKSSIEYFAMLVGIGRTLYGSPASTPMSDDEETNDPLVADIRNFFKVEKWTQDGMHIERTLCGLCEERGTE